MKTLLLALVMLVLIAVGAYYGFPFWYLNTNPKVLIAPRSLSQTPPPEMEGSGQKPDEPNLHPLSATDPLQLMYLNQPLEVRLAAGFKQVDLPLPVLKIGVGIDGTFTVAGIEFWVGEHPSVPVLERETLALVYTGYRMVPQIDEMDIWAVDQPDTRVRKGHELYSINVLKAALVSADPRQSRHQQVEHLGHTWYAPVLTGHAESAPPQPHLTASPTPLPATATGSPTPLPAAATGSPPPLTASPAPSPAAATDSPASSTATPASASPSGAASSPAPLLPRPAPDTSAPTASPTGSP